jgi:hypothetical protein
MNETISTRLSDDKSVRSASSAEINRRMEGHVTSRSTPKSVSSDGIKKLRPSTMPGKITGKDPPPSYHNHQHQYIQTPVHSRNQFQSPNPLSASVSGTNTAQVRLEKSKLSASMSDSDRKIDRLTASKSMFEKDKFAESLAKLPNLNAGRPKKLFPDPRSSSQNRENMESYGFM